MIIQKQVEQEVLQMVEAIIADEPALFVVKVILKGNPGNQKLIVLLDGDEGITIDQCSKVSRGLSAELEEKDLIDGKYHLEVSSAGIDFPLQSVRQYQKNVGRSLKVTMIGGDVLTGELAEVNDDFIVLNEQKKKESIEHKISLRDIDKSMVLVSFK